MTQQTSGNTLTSAQIEAIGTREASEHTSACAVGVIDDQACICGGLVPLTVAERDALVKLAQGLIALGPHIEEMQTRAEMGCNGNADGVCADPEMGIHCEDWCPYCLMGHVARQVRALTEGDGTR